jgi:Protein of unknown function (DUF2934)
MAHTLIPQPTLPSAEHENAEGYPTKRSHESLTLNEIRLRAYRKWTTAGKPAGNSMRFWLDAEYELLWETCRADGERLPS